LALSFLICVVLGVDFSSDTQSDFIQFFAVSKHQIYSKFVWQHRQNIPSHFVQRMYKLQCYVPVLSYSYFVSCKCVSQEIPNNFNIEIAQTLNQKRSVLKVCLLIIAEITSQYFNVQCYLNLITDQYNTIINNILYISIHINRPV
jgi:hypothetical protein